MSNRAVISVLGVDKVGIVANVTQILSEQGANIIDISQTVLQEDLFAMIMLVEAPKRENGLEELRKALEAAGEKIGIKIMVQHEDIFRYMHRI